MWSFLASLAVAIGGGLLLNVLSELTKTTWLTYLLVVVALGCAISLLRGGADSRPAWSWNPIRTRGFHFSLASSIFGGAALLLVAGAISISLYSNATSDQEHFVQLWIVPIPKGGGSTASQAEVGLTNYEGSRDQFAVTVSEPGHVLLGGKHVDLRQGETWTYHVTRNALLQVRVSVAFASQPSRVLASVKLASPVK